MHDEVNIGGKLANRLLEPLDLIDHYVRRISTKNANIGDFVNLKIPSQCLSGYPFFAGHTLKIEECTQERVSTRRFSCRSHLNFL